MIFFIPNFREEGVFQRNPFLILLAVAPSSNLRTALPDQLQPFFAPATFRLKCFQVKADSSRSWVNPYFLSQGSSCNFSRRNLTKASTSRAGSLGKFGPEGRQGAGMSVIGV